MRTIFLLVGVVSTLAAFSIVVSQKKKEPFSLTPEWFKSRKSNHERISGVKFSPDGEKLIFLVSDESGEFHASQTYLYSVNQRTARRLPTNKDGWIDQFFWAPDSKRVAFNRWSPRGNARSVGFVFNIETNQVVEQFRIPLLAWSPDGTKQLFQNNMTGDIYVKEAEKPVWHRVPKEIRKRGDAYCWSPDSQSLLYSETVHSLCRYRLQEETSETLVRMDDYRIVWFLYPSRYSDSVYFFTSRDADKSWRASLLWKLDLMSGMTTQVFDVAFDSERDFVDRIFLSSNDNPIFLNLHREGTWELIKLDTLSHNVEALLEGNVYVWDYSDQHNAFAVCSYEDKFHTLSLLDVEMEKLEHVFPTD